MNDQYLGVPSQFGGQETDVLSVGELTRKIKAAVEGISPFLWVEGEVSNATYARSGHIYFTLKDSDAVLSCVMWRGSASKIDFPLKDGLQVQAFGSLGVYAPRGQYQFMATSMRRQGLGDLQQAFERLRKKLEAEGLFDRSRKRPLPPYPSRVGVVTSPTGAAIRDIVETARQRHPGVHIVISPVKVQGEGAAEEITEALRFLDRDGQCDVIIVARGGGSAEDLWAFNDEGLARAMATCQTPLVSGVGHEVDFTIADYVADHRAPTPTGAAQAVFPVAADLLHGVHLLQERILRAVTGGLRDRHLALSDLCRRLERHTPMERLARGEGRLDGLRERLHSVGRDMLQRRQNSLNVAMGRLQALSPLAILDRGYSVVRLGDGGTVVKDVQQVEVGNEVRVNLARGELTCEVKEKSTP